MGKNIKLYNPDYDVEVWRLDGYVKKYYEEMQYEEMSEILETSVGALKASYHHAVKKIEKYIEEN